MKSWNSYSEKLCKFTYKFSCENWYLNSTMLIYDAIQNCASLQVQSKNRQMFAKWFFSNSRPLITVMSIWELYKYTAINNGAQIIAWDVTPLLTVKTHKMLIQKSNIITYVILHILRIDHVLPHYERTYIIQGKVTSSGIPIIIQHITRDAMHIQCEVCDIWCILAQLTYCRMGLQLS